LTVGYYTGRVRLYYHAGDYYRAGGLFSFVKKAFTALNPVTNPLIRKVSQALSPLARQAGLGKVVDAYEQGMATFDAVMQPPAQEQTPEALHAGGDVLVPQPGDMVPMVAPSHRAEAQLEDEDEDEDDDSGDEG
jgi:hypothetical protein